MMASKNEAKVKFTADTTEFNKSIKSANSELTELKSALKLNQTELNATGNSADTLQSRLSLLQQQSETLAEKKEALNQKLEAAVKYYGEDSDEASKLRTQLNNLESESIKVNAQISDVSEQLDEQAKAANTTESALDKMTGTISEQESELSDLKEQYVNAVLEFGETSDEAQGLAGDITDLSGELKDNRDKLSSAEDAADSFDQTLDDTGDTAKDSESKFDSLSVMLGNLASKAVSELIEKFKELAQEIINTGIETESAMAKLSTIAGVENIDALSDSLSSLAMETGVSSAELADVAYNAISAGVSVEDACDTVEAATKLATAGFTDTDAALSVMTTALNSYGDAVGSAADISDSLIAVQNLGVTTIDELSGSIGKAIATGSAYNVSLGNIESAYVSLTKSGISTEQSTTYLNSMLNELGDTGSSVSEIIQNETGKSFGELMDSGASLGDVLQIVYDSCEGDSEAMMNLWSSSNAGLAANALVNQGLEEFNDNLVTIEGSAGATEDAYSIMSDTMEHKIDVMNTSFEELGNGVFAYFQEPMKDVIDLVIDNVIPAISDLIDWLGKHLGPIFETVGEIIESFTSLTGGEWSDWANLLLQVADEVFGTIFDVINTALEVIQGIIQTVTDIMSGDWDAAFEDIQQITETVFGTIQEVIDTVMSVVQGIIETVWGIIGDKIQTVMDAISGAMGAWDTIRGKISDVCGNVREKVSTAWESVKSKTTDAFSNVKSTISTDLSSAWSTVKGKLDDIGGKFSSVFSSARETVENAIGKIREAFNFTWKLPELKLPHISIKGSFSLNPISVPSFGISWYAQGGVLEAPTIFGESNGTLLGGGEAGPEAVAPIDVLQGYVTQAVESSIGQGLTELSGAIMALASRPVIVSVNGKTIATATVGDMDGAMGTRQSLTSRGLAV